MTDLLPVSGILNARDFGGYATACGRGLRKGVLYRTGHHADASDEDLKTLAGLGLAAIVDLRTGTEKERQPSRRWAGCSVTIIENDIEEELHRWEDFLPGNVPTVALFRGRMLDFYSRAPFMERFRDLFSRYFQVLADSDRPVLIHCVAGKDRTGMLAALTHSLAGVHRDDIAQDYIRTNELVGHRADIHRVAGEYMAKMSGTAPDDETVRYALGCDAAWLEAALTAIEARHGSIDSYLADYLGIDTAARERLHNRLLG